MWSYVAKPGVKSAYRRCGVILLTQNEVGQAKRLIHQDGLSNFHDAEFALSFLVTELSLVAAYDCILRNPT
jgi:hypothetical protein